MPTITIDSPLTVTRPYRRLIEGPAALQPSLEGAVSTDRGGPPRYLGLRRRPADGYVDGNRLFEVAMEAQMQGKWLILQDER